MTLPEWVKPIAKWWSEENINDSEFISALSYLIDNKSIQIPPVEIQSISEDKIPIQMLQKLYRHSSLTTTINYQSNFIHKDADEALESVVDF